MIDWLLDSDPSIRWQVMRDLLKRPGSEWRTGRAKVETEGWGARLLSYEDEDGQWAGGAFLPSGFDLREWQEVGQPWTATTFALSQLREFGLDPASDRARRAVELVGANSRWDHAGEPYWEGEVEECINGRVVADGAYFGVDVSPIVDRLVRERLADGGWNCERANGSARSSFATTINVLEASSSTREWPEARHNLGKRAGPARSISSSATCSGASAQANRPTSNSFNSCTRAGGVTTSSALWTTSAPPPSWASHLIRGSAKQSTTSVPDGARTAPGSSTGPRPVESGSTWTTGSASPLVG